MNWYSRSAYGVLIGVLSMFACIGVSIYKIYVYLYKKNKRTKNTFCLYENHLGILLSLLIFLLLIILFTGLLIWGIIKVRSIGYQVSTKIINYSYRDVTI